MTIKDLARLSGYSVGTVSRALNGLPNVSEQARSAILRWRRNADISSIPTRSTSSRSTAAASSPW